MKLTKEQFKNLIKEEIENYGFEVVNNDDSTNKFDKNGNGKEFSVEYSSGMDHKKEYFSDLESAKQFALLKQKYGHATVRKTINGNLTPILHFPYKKQNIKEDINAVSDINKEIYDEIEMRMRPTDDKLPYDEINEIAEEYNTDIEVVAHIMSSYIINREIQKEEDLKYDINYTLRIYFEKNTPPSFEEFYNTFKTLGWDNVYDIQIVKEMFEKLIKDPNQLTMFESKNKMKLTKEQFTKLIREGIKKELMEGRAKSSSIMYHVDDPNDLEGEIEVSVDFDYTSAVPGVPYMSNGDPGNAPEPAEIFITSIQDRSGNEIHVNDEKLKEIEEYIYDKYF